MKRPEREPEYRRLIAKYRVPCKCSFNERRCATCKLFMDCFAEERGF